MHSEIVFIQTCVTLRVLYIISETYLVFDWFKCLHIGTSLSLNQRRWSISNTCLVHFNC
mgnify:CR=1 FL=1